MNAAIVDTDVVSMLFKGGSRPKHLNMLQMGRGVLGRQPKGPTHQTIAACTLHYQVPLITNNARDYTCRRSPPGYLGAIDN